MHNTSFPQPGAPCAQAQAPANLPQENTPPAVAPVTQPAPQSPVVDAQAATPNLLHPGAMMAQMQQAVSVTAAPLLGAAAGSKRNAPDSGFDQQMNGMAPGAWEPPDAMPMPYMPFADAWNLLPHAHGYGWFNHGLPVPGYGAGAPSFNSWSPFGPQDDPESEDLDAPSPPSSPRDPQDKLILAASDGDEETIRALLAAGVDVNAADREQLTALILAAENGHEAIVRILLAVQGIDIHAKDCDGKTALRLAIEKWLDGIERMILAALGDGSDTTSDSSNAALISAVAKADESAVRALLAKPHIDINSKKEFGLTALHVAASLGNQTILRSLLARPDIDVNATDVDGRTALIRASKKGHEVIVRELLERPDINVTAYCMEETEINHSEGYSALEFAAKNGHEAIVLALLAMPGIDYESIHSSLCIAAQRRNGAIVEALLAMPGIKANGASAYVTSPLIRAVQYGHEAVVEALLAMPDIDVNALGPYGDSALLEAVRGHHEDIVHTLLAIPGIRVDVMHKCGYTPLSFAIAIEHDAIATALRNHVPATPAEPAAVLNLLQTIFTIHSGKPQQSTASSADIALNPDSAGKLDKLCESLQFGKCAAADVPALFTAIGSLPADAHSSLARSLAFGFFTGCYRNAAGALDEAIAAAIDKAGMRAAYDDAVGKLSLAAKHINLFRIGGMNLLGIAAEAGNERMIRGLIRLGAYVNVPSPNGKTALAIAVENRQWSACAELVSLGALPTLPLHDGYPALYHIVQDFNSGEHCCESLALLIRYLRKKGVPFDILVKNPDASMREERSTVPLYELLVRNAESWINYHHILLDPRDAPPPAAPASMDDKAIRVDAPKVATQAALHTPSIAEIRALLTAGDALAGFIAWLDADPRHLQWQDPQSRQGLLHLAATAERVDAVQLLLARCLDRQQHDSTGRAPADLLPRDYMSTYTEATRRIAGLLQR